MKDSWPFLTRLIMNPGLQGGLSYGRKVLMESLLWYNPVPLQNVHAARFPRGSKNPTGGSSSFALGFKCYSCLYVPQIPFLSCAAGLVYSSSVSFVSGPSYFHIGFTNPSEYLRKIQPFTQQFPVEPLHQYSLCSSASDVIFGLGRGFCQGAYWLLTAFSNQGKVVIPLYNTITQPLKGLTEAYRTLHLSNSQKERKIDL